MVVSRFMCLPPCQKWIFVPITLYKSKKTISFKYSAERNAIYMLRHLILLQLSWVIKIFQAVTFFHSPPFWDNEILWLRRSKGVSHNNLSVVLCICQYANILILHLCKMIFYDSTWLFLDLCACLPVKNEFLFPLHIS